MSCGSGTRFASAGWRRSEMWLREGAHAPQGQFWVLRRRDEMRGTDMWVSAVAAFACVCIQASSAMFSAMTSCTRLRVASQYHSNFVRPEGSEG